MERREQSQAMRDAEDLGLIVDDLVVAAQEVFVRNRFSSGEKVRPKKKEKDFGDLTPPPAYADPTGEGAILNYDGERVDGIEVEIKALATTIRNALVSARRMVDMANEDVSVRAMRTVPDCLACGDPCHGRIRSGFDEKCYKRWIRAQRPDRVLFITGVKQEREVKKAEQQNAV